MTKADTPPVRDDLKHLTPYGAPQIDVPVRLNTNENPYPPSPGMVRAVADAVAEAAATLHRPEVWLLKVRLVVAGEVDAFASHRAGAPDEGLDVTAGPREQPGGDRRVDPLHRCAHGDDKPKLGDEQDEDQRTTKDSRHQVGLG